MNEKPNTTTMPLSGGVCRRLYPGSCGPCFCEQECTHNLGYDPLSDTPAKPETTHNHVVGELLAEIRWLRDALKDCWEARHDPDKIERLVFENIAPAAAMTDDDIQWAKARIAELEAANVKSA